MVRTMNLDESRSFHFFRKHAESAIARSSSGRATENDRVPNFVRVRGTSYNPDAAERRCERPGSSVSDINMFRM